jgi:hypothetical protein
MKKELFLIILPGICGLLLLVISQIDLYFFGERIITARQAVGHEIIFFLGGLCSSLILFVLSIKWLFSNRWKQALIGVTSSLSFCIFFMIAGANGAAILNAT